MQRSAIEKTRDAQPQSSLESERENRSVLACVSASPSNRKVIASAARFARGSRRSFTALYIDDGRLREDDKGLLENLQLARNLGAQIERISQKDVISAITQYARQNGVTDLFIGYSGPSSRIFSQHHPAYRLIQELPEADVHIIADASVQLRPSGLESRIPGRINFKDILRLILIMSIATALCVVVDHSRFSNSNIVTIYILAVLITAAMTAERIYGIIAAVLYILLFNFLFITPRFSFLVYDPDYMVTYLVSVIAAIITGNISSRMKEITLRSRMHAYQTQILLNASESLQRAQGMDQIIQITVSRLKELLGREITYCDTDTIRNDPQAIRLFVGTEADESYMNKCRDAVDWTLEHNQRAGWGTDHYSDLDHQYLCVRTGDEIYGILSVDGSAGPLNQFEENILLALISECALSIEGEKNRKEREEAQIIAENERFRSKLLRSVSHDLRTPLTSISGNAANLLTHAEEFTQDERNDIYSDIYEDSIWLIDLVENLLMITRLEEKVDIHPTGEVVADVLETAVENARRHRCEQQIILEADNECLVAEMDVPLILQVVDNLIGNAVKHTPPSTKIRVRDWREGDLVYISVSDDGPGISPEDKSHIFEMFYTGKQQEADSSRSLGLGLNLCRSILERHGQTIECRDNTPCGAEFVFSLKIWEGQET